MLLRPGCLMPSSDMAYAVLRFAWRCPGLTHSMASVKSAEKQLMQAESRASFDSTESRYPATRALCHVLY